MQLLGGIRERKMSKLKGILAVCLLFMIAASAQAQIKIVVDNQTIPTEDIASIVILPNSNLISISTTVGYTVERTGTTPPDAVAISSFSASPSTITEGQRTTLSWVTSNASSCTASGGAGGWNTTTITLPTGSQLLTINNPGTYTFVLTCQDSAGGTAQRSTVVTVQENSTPTQCSTPPLSGSTTTWKNFWLVDFPSPKYDNVFATVPRTGYLAIEFETGNIIDDGKISSVETTVTDGVRLGTISQCPGDFDVEAPCKYIWGIGGGLLWATNGMSNACQLEPNTKYYFNLTFTDVFNPATTSCKTFPCITTLQATNF